MNPFFMVAFSISSIKPIMVFTVTDPENSVEDYLNAVTANLILNIGPERINTPLHQNWIHRRSALLQNILKIGTAQKRFSVLPIDTKWDLKRFTQKFSKIFDSEQNKRLFNSERNSSTSECNNETTCGMKQNPSTNSLFSQYTWLQNYENDINPMMT